MAKLWGYVHYDLMPSAAILNFRCRHHNSCNPMYMYTLGITVTQEQLWRETIDDSAEAEDDCRRGGNPGTKQLNPKMMHDIQTAVSRLVTKAGQLISNETTNLAESWMHIRSKYDGAKVINRSQSGSWEHRCMGAGLQQNIGKEWGPKMWSQMTSTPSNSIFVASAEQASKRAEKDGERKARDEVKVRRRMAKYSRKDNTTAARKAYSRHDNHILPDDVSDDVSADILTEMKESYYNTNVVVTKEEAAEIEVDTREQANSDLWKSERRKRLTASRVGGILKMRKTTSRANKVKELRNYTTFRGNQATKYGMEMEDIARTEYHSPATTETP